jgi:hypothetical protein
MPRKAASEVLFDGPVDYYSMRRCPSKRPCSKLNCRHHLAVDWKGRNGSALGMYVFPDAELDELPETCALDVAQKYDGLPLHDVGTLLSITRERVRQIELKALRKIRRQMASIVKALEL